MNYKEIKKALFEVGYKPDSIKSLMCGRSKPSYTKAELLEDRFSIPIWAWKDIQSFLSPSSSNSIA